MDARNLCEFRKKQIISTETGKKKYISRDTELQIIGRWGSSPPSDVCLLTVFFILLSSLVISYYWKQAALLDEPLL